MNFYNGRQLDLDWKRGNFRYSSSVPKVRKGLFEEANLNKPKR